MKNKNNVKTSNPAPSADITLFACAYLSNSECIVEVTECIKLPLLPLNSNEELLNTLQRQLVTLYQDPEQSEHGITILQTK